MKQNILENEALMRFPYLLCETDEKDIILYASKSYFEMTGYSSDEFIGASHNIVFHPDVPESYLLEGLKEAKEKGFWTGHIKKIHKNGKNFFWVYVTILKRVLPSGTVTLTFISIPPISGENRPCE